MNLRLALYALAERHDLDAAAAAELDRLAGFDGQPPQARALALRALAVVAALLVGLGVVMWVAANWDDLGRFGRFALLQGFVTATLLGAWLRPAARAPLSLLATLGIGGLFAYFGQTYQTGADPWQLFALWAALALPLALAVAADVVWVPWTVVAFTAISLWIHTHSSHSWRVEAVDLWVHGVAWTLATGLVLLLGGPLRQRAGAGPWSLRAALLLTVTMVTLASLGGLFASRLAPHYLLGLLFLAALVGLRGRRRDFDVFAVSAAAFGLNVLLDAGLARLLFDRGGSGGEIGKLMLLGLVAAGLLAASVSLILGRLRQRGERFDGGER